MYQALATTPTSSTDLGTALGSPLGRTRQYLEQLAAAGLAHHRTAGWSRPPTDRRNTTAHTLGCAGILAARQRRHHLERQAWQWWLDELTWRRASRAEQRRTPAHGPCPSPVYFPPGTTAAPTPPDPTAAPTSAPPSSTSAPPTMPTNEPPADPDKMGERDKPRPGTRAPQA